MRDFTRACLLTAMVLAIELLAITTGEVLVALTVLSTLPLYLLARKNIVFTVLSYVSIGLILGAINPHQCLFFAATNGLLGLVLGVCDQKRKHRMVSVFLSSLSLFFGTVAVAFVIGLLLEWWMIAVLLPFCVVYTGLYRTVALKVYAKCTATKWF